MQAALRNEPLEVHGDGLQSRDFTYIDNVVDANILSCTTPGVGGRVYNIACGERHSLLDIAEIVGRFVGRELPRRHTEPRRGDVRHTLASIDAVRRDLNYEPGVAFEEGLRRTFEALKKS
jgi:nucleoside-diphosphate-sugar epimerase